MKSQSNDFLIHTNFLTLIKISLFCYLKKVFIFKNIWMIWKNSIKHYYLKIKIFTVLKFGNIIASDYTRAKRVSKDFGKKSQDNIMICIFKAILYCQLMYFRTFKIFVSKYFNLILLIFLLHQLQHGKQLFLKKEKQI